MKYWKYFTSIILVVAIIVVFPIKTSAAVTQTGSASAFNITTANTGTVSTTITVPSDATMVVVGVSGFRAEATFLSGGNMTFTKGGVDTTMRKGSGGDSGTSSFQSAIFYLESPDTGSNKTLKWDWQGTNTASNAPIIEVIFFTGTDVSATPVRGTAGGINTSDTPYTSGTITAQSGDLIVAAIAGFAGTSEGTCASYTNLSTTIVQYTRFGSADGALASGSPSGNTTVSCATDTNWADGGIVGISIKSSGVVAANVPVVEVKGTVIVNGALKI